MAETVAAAIAGKVGQGRLVTVAAGATVRDAVDTMVGERLGAVLIENEDGLIDGIFTERDLLRRVVHERRDPETTPISLVMTRDVRFVTPGTTIEAALALMHVNRFRHLLVMDGPRVLGLVSSGDMAGQLLQHGEGRFEAEVRKKAEPISAEETN
jgi:CBS domain-containing protein